VLGLLQTCGPDLPGPRPLRADRPCPFGRLVAATVSPHQLAGRQCRTVYLLSIAYATASSQWPRLRSRLTLG
jgi:hypothetical protein